MAEPLTLRFTPTPQDYVEATRALAWRGRGRRTVWFALAGFEFLLICALFSSDYGRTPVAWLVTFLIPIILLSLLVGLPYRVGWSVKGNDRLLAEVTWELSSETVVLKNRYTETKYDWGSFQSLIENKHYFFLRQSAAKQFYNFIPKRVFVSLEQETQFREFANWQILTHMDSAVASPRPGNPLSLVVRIAIISFICIMGLGGMLYVWFAPFVFHPGPPLLTAPMPLPTQTASGYVDQARAQIYTKQYPQAIPLLDQAIQLDPQNGDAYYMRAYSYGQMVQTEHVYTVEQTELNQALQDIDDAIVYGLTDPNVPRGEPYYLRYQLYSISHADSDADVVAMQPVLRENLRMAEALGTVDKYMNQYIVYTYFAEHNCQGGIAEIQRIREKYGLSAPPNASLYNLDGTGYVCLGQYDRALASIDKGLNIESIPDRLNFRALILYYLGRKQEALDILNGLIAANPQFHADWYYLRALIEYDLGNPQQANDDLTMGDDYSWDHRGLAAYVRGRIDYDLGDKPRAGTEFQTAYSTLPWFYNPLLSDTANKLAALGQPTPAVVPSGMVLPTPMAAPPALPTPDFPISPNGIQLPPFPTPVSMDRGTGPLGIMFVNRYPVLLFQPSQSTSVQSVQALTIHILPSGPTTITQFEIFLWNPTTGEWTMFKQGWQDIQVLNPAQYVADSGDVYLAVRTDTGVILAIKQLWLTLQYTPVGGSPATLDLSP